MSNVERRQLISAFNDTDLNHMCSIWEKKGYYRQGNTIIERVSFQEKTTRVSRPVYLQLMIMDAVITPAEVTEDGA